MSRKLDAAIAEELGVSHLYPVGKDLYYSTDGNDMLKLDAEMRARGYQLHLRRDIHEGTISEGDPRVFNARYYQPGNNLKNFPPWYYVGFAETMPLAVALAAYYALTGKEWVEPVNP